MLQFFVQVQQSAVVIIGASSNIVVFLERMTLRHPVEERTEDALLVDPLGEQSCAHLQPLLCQLSNQPTPTAGQSDR